MRLAEEWGKFLGVLFGLRKTGKWEEFEAIIRTSAQKYTGIEIEYAERLADENFISFLIKNHNLNEENLKLLGDLLYEKGLMYMATDRKPVADNALYKTFLLYNYIKNNSLESDFSLDMHYKLKTIRELLGIK